MKFIDLFEVEIDISRCLIRSNKKLIKMCYWGINFNGSIILFMIISAYYLLSYNWVNGFCIGVNLLCLIENIVGIRNYKSEIEIQDIRIKLYEEIKKQLAQCGEQAGL